VHPKLLAAYFGCSALHIVFNVLVIPILIALPFIVVGFASRQSIVEGLSIDFNLIDMIFLWLVSVMLCMFGAWRLIVTSEHKLMVNSFIRKKLSA
jgi:purine-cytosine permease-like protein